MKITIEYDDMTSSIEFGEFDLHEFRDHLRSLLHTVWLPSQVDDIIPTEESLSDEFAEVRKQGYEEGFDAGKEEGFDKGREYGHKKGYATGHGEGYKDAVAAMRETYEPMLEKTAKDSERLDFLLSTQSWLAMHQLGTRQEIDQSMKDQVMEEENK